MIELSRVSKNVIRSKESVLQPRVGEEIAMASEDPNASLRRRLGANLATTTGRLTFRHVLVLPSPDTCVLKSWEWTLACERQLQDWFPFMVELSARHPP